MGIPHEVVNFGDNIVHEIDSRIWERAESIVASEGRNLITEKDYVDALIDIIGPSAFQFLPKRYFP